MSELVSMQTSDSADPQRSARRISRSSRVAKLQASGYAGTRSVGDVSRNVARGISVGPSALSSS